MPPSYYLKESRNNPLFFLNIYTQLDYTLFDYENKEELFICLFIN